MTHLLQSRRAAVVALLTALLGAAAMYFGAAAEASPCNDSPTPQDMWVDVGTLAHVGVGSHNDGVYTGANICATPPGTAVFVGYANLDASNPGMIFYVDECPGPTYACHGVIQGTGAEVEADVNAEEPADGDSVTGADAGAGPATCVWVNGPTPTCPGGVTVAGITVNEGDLPAVTTTSTSPPPPCTGVNNTCPGAYVVVGGDTGNDTVETKVGPSPLNADVPRTCVQVNSVCP